MLRYRLRTLFAILAVACIVATVVGYRIRAQNPFRDFLAGFNYNFGADVTDPEIVATLLRQRSQEFPRHKPTDEEIIRLSERVFHAGYQKLQQSQVVGRCFYRVELADKSQTRVGMWVYRKEDGRTGATVVVYGRDSVPERAKERFALYDDYQAMMEKIDLELTAPRVTTD